MDGNPDWVFYRDDKPSAEKPRDLVIAENIKPLLEAGDATSAMIRYQQMMAESKVQARPARLGRHRR